MNSTFQNPKIKFLDYCLAVAIKNDFVDILLEGYKKNFYRFKLYLLDVWILKNFELKCYGDFYTDKFFQHTILFSRSLSKNSENWHKSLKLKKVIRRPTYNKRI